MQAAVDAEDVPASTGVRGPFLVGGEDGEGLGVDGDPVGAVGLGWAQDRTVGPIDESAGEGHRGVREVDVGPPQGEELATTGAGARGETEVGVEVRCGVSDVGEELVDLRGLGRSDLGGLVPWWAGGAGGVDPDPVPPLRLGEGTVQDAVDTADRAG